MSDNKSNKKGAFTKEMRDQFINELYENNFNVGAVCAIIGISRNTFYYTLKHDDDFANMIDISTRIFNNIIQTSMYEGLTCNDLRVRKEYLSLIPKSAMAKAFGVKEDLEGVTIIDKDKIILK